MASWVRLRAPAAALMHMVDPTKASASPPGPPSGSTRLPSRRRVLLSYHELPDWYQDSDCILRGYRPPSASAAACFASWRYLHNETVNIFSHLLPALLCLGAAAGLQRVLGARYPDASAADRLVFAAFFLAAATCLALSALYHTFLCHSLRVSGLWLQLDYAGIVVLTLGNFVSGIYVGFYCEPRLQRIYWAMILTLSIITIITLLSSRFQGPRWRTFRVGMFVGTGLSGFAPIIHGIKIFGYTQMNQQAGLVYYFAEGLLLMIAVLFYTTRIPESLRPGMFDLFGGSHQIFHVLVVIATAVHLAGILSAFDYNYKYQRCGLG